MQVSENPISASKFWTQRTDLLIEITHDVMFIKDPKPVCTGVCTVERVLNFIFAYSCRCHQAIHHHKLQD